MREDVRGFFLDAQGAGYVVTAAEGSLPALSNFKKLWWGL